MLVHTYNSSTQGGTLTEKEAGDQSQPELHDIPFQKTFNKPTK